jgi:hypothetical protein
LVAEEGYLGLERGALRETKKMKKIYKMKKVRARGPVRRSDRIL